METISPPPKSPAQKQQARLDTARNKVVNDIKEMKTLVEEYGEEIKRLVNQRMSELMQQLDTLQRETISEIDARKELLGSPASVDGNFSFSPELGSIGLKGCWPTSPTFDIYSAPVIHFEPMSAIQLEKQICIGHVKKFNARLNHKLPVGESIWSVTSFGNELYVLCLRDKDQVDVYESTTYSLQRRLSVPGLSRVGMADMTSCRYNQCLYISDIENNSVHRMTADDVISEWPVGDKPGSMSVTITDHHHVLVTCATVCTLREFTTSGQLIRDIKLPSDVANPWHAIQLPSGQFVVSHGGPSDRVHRVCMVDADGHVVRSYGGHRGSETGQLDGPCHLAVDNDGFIFVADCNNARVLLLNPSLNFVGDVVSRDHCLRCPTNLYLDADTRRLCVGQYNRKQLIIIAIQ